MTKETIIAQFEELLKNDDFKVIQAGIGNIRSSFKKAVEATSKQAEELLQGDAPAAETVTAPAALSETTAASEEAADANNSDNADDDSAPAASEAPKDEQDTLFEQLFALYNEKKAAYQAAREEERQRREEERIAREAALREKAKEQDAILAEMTEFVTANDLTQAGFQRFKEIQAKWNAIGRVNLEEAKKTQSEYAHQVDVYFHHRTLMREAQAIEHDRNLTAKLDLIGRVEQLIGNESANEIAAAMKKLQAEWNGIGQVAFSKKDEIYAKFKEAADQVYGKVQQFYDSRRENSQQNHTTKMEVIEQVKTIVAGEYTTHEEWQAKTNEVLKIQEEWKNIGYSDDNEITWQTFRAVCDMFFDKKKEFYNNIDDTRIQNKNKKVELCEKAEEMRFDTDWTRTANFFVQLQKQWKDVGPTLRSEENKLWERFRLACDTFFEAKKKFFEENDSEQTTNLQAKTELIERLKAFEVSGDSDFEALQEFSAQWNSIGFVPIKEKDRLQKEYNRLLDEKYGAARKLRNEAGGGSASGGGNRNNRNNDRPRNDRNRSNDNRQRSGGGGASDVLREKIERKQEEITQYENNLGFFASSKKPSPIVQDLQNKLTQLKSELKALHDQLKAALATPPPAAPTAETATTEAATADTTADSSSSDEAAAPAADEAATTTDEANNDEQ